MIFRNVRTKFSDALAAAGWHGAARGFWHGLADDGTVVLTAWSGEYDDTEKARHRCTVKRAFAQAHLKLGADVRVVMVKQAGEDPQGRALPGFAHYIADRRFRVTDLEPAVFNGNTPGFWVSVQAA